MDAAEWMFITLAGLCAGSVITMLVYRLPLMILHPGENRLNLGFPGSHCPHCHSGVRWHDNVPLLGWFLLKGECRFCRQPVSRRYPLTEGGTALLTLGVAMLSPSLLLCLVILVFGWSVIALTLIDFEHYLLPDALTQFLLWSGLLLNAAGLMPWLNTSQAIYGAMAGYGSFRIISLGYALLRKKEGLGRGDAKLMAALGAWLGAEALPTVVFLATLLTLAGIVAARLIASRELSKRVPFGPALSVAGFSLLLNFSLR